MKLLRPSPEVVPFAVRALKTVALARGDIAPGARALLEAAQQVFAGAQLDLDALPEIMPRELAEHLREPAARAQLVHGMVTLALVDGVPPKTQMESIRAFGEALDVRDGSVEALVELVDGRFDAFRWCFLRRAHFKGLAKQQLQHAGLLGTARGIATMFGLTEDPKLAERYASLESHPAGSLGRELHVYYLRNRFSWPGQRNAAPEAIVSHDVSHIIAGYDTDPIGETLVAAFSAGYQQDPHAIFTPLVGLVMFSTGVRVVPNPNVPTLRVDAFAEPGVAARWIRAIDRGSRMNVDLIESFDLWSVASEPLDELRKRWNVEPE